MAGYGYQHRSTAAYTSPQTDEWSKPSYASDHVCRPVIIDAEGRKRPIVAFTPNQNSEYYVTRTTETIIQEQIVSPFASEIKQSPLRSPRGREIAEEKWQKHPSPVHDGSPKVDEFFAKVQNEASRPKFSPASASTWRQTPKPVGDSSEFNNYNNDWIKPPRNGYRNDIYDHDYSSYGNNTSNGWNKPISTDHFLPASNIITAYKEPSSPASTNTPHYRHVDPVLVDTFDGREATPKEATMITHGRWVRPTPTTWASVANSNLTKPTSDIPTAIGILKEVAKPFVSTNPSSWHTEPRYTETIDSAEAAKRYGNFGKLNFSPKPYVADNNYTTIDSREAARKYRGTAV